MSPESSPRSEKRGTLLQTLKPERMVKIVEQTMSLRAADRLYEVMLDRLALNDSLENQIAVDRLSYLRDEALEIAIMNADFKAPDDDDIAFEEEINEALFKDFGEEQ